MDQAEEEQWKLRVAQLLRERGPQSPSAIGSLVRRTGCRRGVQAILRSDARFVADNYRSPTLFSLVDQASSAASEDKNKKPKKKPKTTQKLTPFKPQKTAFQPPDICWEVVLANPHTAVALAQWRWLWLLPQVCRAFHDGVQPGRWVRTMCAADSRPTIWKAKANALFALTPRDMANVKCTVVEGTGFMRYKETHLMRRDTVLELALAKHGGTYAAINSAFLKRVEAKEMRKAAPGGR